jgi:hypothetical protein
MQPGLTLEGNSGFPRKSLSKYLIMDTIYFNKHVHDINIFINDKWRKYAGGDIGQSGFNLHVHSGQKPVLQKLVIVFSLHNMQPGLTLEGNSGKEVTL